VADYITLLKEHSPRRTGVRRSASFAAVVIGVDNGSGIVLELDATCSV
jgi:hypothetical protein